MLAASHDIHFVTSVFNVSQLPAPEYPEIAFAGRSNVGKSSLINRLLNRQSLVKVSARPGKTQSLNYFLVGEALYLVDLPGYGYAKVPKKMQAEWQGLISEYLENRATLRCVVVIVDLRHSTKPQDLELLNWLRSKDIPCLLVYTKRDKLKANECSRQTAILDAGFGVTPAERVLFSAKTGDGKEKLILALEKYLQ
ncbi:MAG: ribosome biogenesis GTP-binding protein YihA/YsxC [Proteobacteria bacterium]|nr:ribosome biogenesis GTP-binding protein YihA/YsxC [Pseudomonadota bacterium]MBU1716076.1 ribosome biogenesis GTP-binding protein YihA/YsxC [Pseudomonadota bacterium]